VISQECEGAHIAADLASNPVVAYGRPYCAEQVVLSVRLGCRPPRVVGPWIK
jgi:hypothetical protein